MIQIQWKQFITEMLLFFSAVAPLYHLVIQLIKLEREAAIARREIRLELKHVGERLENLEKRMDNFENWRSASSGFKV